MLACCLFSVSFAVLLMMNSAHSMSYMDEIFHIPQAQRYCRYNFHEWDSMITTLPGMYLASFLIARVTVWINYLAMGSIDFCSVLWLRFHNLIYATGNFIVMYKLLEKFHCPLKVGNMIRINSGVTAFIISGFPLLYFFTFLYYTDQGSTFFTLLCYLFSLNMYHKTAAFIGIIAILFRQTNVIWVMFAAGVSIAQIYDASFKVSAVQEKLALSKDYRTYYDVFILITKRQFRKIISISWPYIIVILAFIIFVIVNGGIVVGDRNNHQPALHIPQLWYFLSFSLFFAAPHLCRPSYVFSFFNDALEYWYLTLSGVVVMAFSVYKFTFVHTYLLADNRHYTFYVWRRLYNAHPSIPYLIIPMHLYTIYIVYKTLAEKRSNLWIAIFTVAVTLVTIPQRLLEFRYFILPYIIMRLNFPLMPYPFLLLEIFIYFAINYLTIFNFISSPFVWLKSGEIQRFMW
ncbi:uncharacterized protein TRIADDRAFT_28403 [Trichoplax adhaerens]|uniref:Dol-P-Glc:Glc(2)Man(9)GlcNAc(2)-PP-Dol alpha-1,2-glucosyltransferase n=1 Tax=Trichoplax adhaerens TaxID=10228 RepID=B3S3F0_TRIAD|nr:hypothetical protein TRIADDRAFT_28403 [Trichoplax adhaerens]EDV22779.1 hypothetical protein TRIADDRAFT_28403 [Trichoplax adhaerens]|eukprot:XP_002114645.1 hypothetical protein TRIADDRAFT_28403 [Trichoplax adhaerens]